MQAQDVMTSPAKTVTPEATVQEIAATLSAYGISAVPVVNDSGEIVGVVSEGDLLRRRELGTVPHPSRWLAFFENPVELDEAYLKATARTASAIMSREVVSVDADTSVIEIAEILAEKHIKRVPVLRDGRLAGIVSRADLVRALATQKPASEPEPEPGDREIRQEVLLVVRALKAVDRPDINVIVESGIVSVWGYIQNEERRVPIVEAIKNVPGVKAVEDHLATFPAWYWAE